MRHLDWKSRGVGFVVAATMGLALAGPLFGGELTRAIRSKLSAGDLRTGEALAEDWKLAHGEDAEYLDAQGWLARGAQLLGQYEKAMEYVREVRRRITGETDENRIPLGAAIEVEGRVILARDGRGAALAYLHSELARVTDPALRSRISKNIALISLEGSPAPAIDFRDALGPVTAGLSGARGKPILLFFWAHWCGDCKAQAPAVARLTAKYGPKGLVVVAPTRYYGTGKDNQEVPPDVERTHMADVLRESYAGFESIPVPIDEAAMVRYGASATPTFALVDRKGMVRLYTPTRMSEAELERRIGELLAE